MRNVIAILAPALILVSVAGSAIGAPVSLQKKIDSLFVIASSGEVMFRDQVQPAIDSLAALGADAVPALIEKLDTKSARDRVTLMQIFKKIGPPAVPFLSSALRLGDGLMVERACMALAEIADSSAVPALSGVTTHRRWQVREQALTALSKLKSIRAASVVMTAMSDSIGQVRKSAAVACGQLRLNDAIRPLVHMLGDSFYGARMCAATALALLDTSSVESAVTDSLHSANPLVGNLGCHLLGGIPSEAVMETLLLETQAPNPYRRAHAALALLAADPDDRCGFRETYFMLETDPLVRLKIESALSGVSHGRP